MSTNQEVIFNELLDEYQRLKGKANTNPHGNHKEGFNQEAHKYCEGMRGQCDLLLVRLIEMRPDAVKFATVEKHGDIYHVVYNPFGEELDAIEDMTYDIFEAAPLKPKGLKIYEKNTNGKIKWFYKVISCPIDMFFNFKLGKWFDKEDYKGNLKGFGQEVSDIIRYYPHAECHKFAPYIEYFLTWMMGLDDDLISIEKAMDAVMDKLQYVFFPKDREPLKAKGILEQSIQAYSTLLSWQDCSKYCNDEFSLLDFKIEKHVNFIEEFKKKAAEARMAKQAKLALIKQPAKPTPPKLLKRKRDEEEEKEKEDEEDINVDNDEIMEKHEKQLEKKSKSNASDPNDQ